MSTTDAAPVAYDFRRPNKFNRDHVRALQIVGETFARQFTTVLSTSLRAVSQVQLVGVGQLTYDEYVREAPNPTFLATLTLEPLPGLALLHVPLDVVMAMVDRFLGGTGDGEMPARPLTDIEAGLVRNLMDRVLRELSYAFEPLVPITPRIVQFESNPQFAQITGSTDMVITLDLDLRIGSHEGRANLCVPFSSLQSVLLEASSTSMRSNPTTFDADVVRHAMHSALAPAPVEVSVRFRSAQLSSAEILDLRPGDVVPLAHHVDRPLTVSIAGVDCFPARPGQRGRRLACLLVPAERADGLPTDPFAAVLATAAVHPQEPR
ncbi:MAG: flagellar motor switch protein FliM [Actinomycetota bacterium]|nr:flagellar motor switch protein FliM [Actinomycetota bacterium]